jgi:hypothetical protein
MNDDVIRNKVIEDDEKDNIDPTDCMIVDRPPKKSKISIIPSQVDFAAQSLSISPHINPTNDDLIDKLCMCISMVDDVSSLE